MLETERLVAGIFDPPHAQVAEDQNEQQQEREARDQRRETWIETPLSRRGGRVSLIDSDAAIDYLAFRWFGFGVKGH